LSIIFRVAR